LFSYLLLILPSFEVIDRCGGDEKKKWPCRTD